MQKNKKQALDVVQSRLSALPWKRTLPFIKLWSIKPEHIDHYEHVNNVAYVSQIEKLAWQHSNSLGLSMNDYRALNRGMVIQQHVLNYHLSCYVNDDIACATWIIACDRKLRLSREFQFISVSSGKTVFSAETHFVCVSIRTGLPKKMPDKFIDIYGAEATKQESEH